MDYFFQCPKCGPYHPDPAFFEASVPRRLKERLREKTASQNVVQVILEFQIDCPRCNPNSIDDYNAKLDIVSEVEGET